MTEGFTLLQTFQPQTVRNIFSPHTRMFSLPSAKLQKRKALLALKVPLDRSRLRFDHWFPVSGHTRGFRVEGEPKMWAICMMISTNTCAVDVGGWIMASKTTLKIIPSSDRIGD